MYLFPLLFAVLDDSKSTATTALDGFPFPVKTAALTYSRCSILDSNLRGWITQKEADSWTPFFSSSRKIAAAERGHTRGRFYCTVPPSLNPPSSAAATHLVRCSFYQPPRKPPATTPSLSSLLVSPLLFSFGRLQSPLATAEHQQRLKSQLSFFLSPRGQQQPKVCSLLFLSQQPSLSVLLDFISSAAFTDRNQ